MTVSRVASVVLGVVILAAAGLGVWFLVSALGAGFLALDPDTRSAVLAFVGVVLVAISTIATQLFVSRHQTREQLVGEKRREFYQELAEAFLSFFDKNAKERQSPADISARLQSLLPPMIAYASPKFIRAWNLFRAVSAHSSASTDGALSADEQATIRTGNTFLMMAAMENLLGELRKDLGHRVSEARYGDLMGVTVNDMDFEGVRDAKKRLATMFPGY